MLADFYSETITIKHDRTGDAFTGYTYSQKDIAGAVQHKRKKVINNQGVEVISESTLFTNEALENSDLINYNSKDREIISTAIIRDHFGSGNIDHYEYSF